MNKKEKVLPYNSITTNKWRQMMEIENQPFNNHYRLRADSGESHQWMLNSVGGLICNRRIV